MTTNEFIKMLQEADPSGEAHLRMDGGVPNAAVLKEGYWDGPYSYINENNEYVYTTEGMKVDIYCTDVWDFADNAAGWNDGVTWEEVKKRFKFRLGYSNKDSRNEREESILKEAKEAFDFCIDSRDRLYRNALEEMEVNAKKGWTWFQNKEVDEEGGMHHYYTWKVLDENGNDQGSNIHNTESIQKSKKWDRIDNDKVVGYYEWIYNN